MPQAVETVLTYLSITLLAAFWILIFFKLVKNKIAPVKTVEAVVADKNKYKEFTRQGNRERYVVIFLVNGNKKSFFVSSFSYGGYRIGEKGKLKYKGDRLIDFK